MPPGVSGKLVKLVPPDFKAKMHQIRFPLGFYPSPAGGADRALKRLHIFSGLLLSSNGKEGRRRGGGEGGMPELGSLDLPVDEVREEGQGGSLGWAVQTLLLPL